MNKTLKKSILVALLSAISCVLYSFPKFPLPFFPTFLEINFSMLPVFIAGFALGVKEGLLVVLIRFIVKLIILSSHTAGVGEIADLIMGSVIILLTSLIFSKTDKSKKSLAFTLSLGIGIWVYVGVISNWLFSLPMYVKLYFGGSKEAIIGLLNVLPGTVTVDNYVWKYLLFAVVPFNLIISIIVCLITYLVYYRLKNYLEED